MEVIVLAGGLGTRLRSMVPSLPKCLAEINEVPFIKYIIEYLKQNNINRIIFSLGYKSEYVVDYINKYNFGIDIVYSIEDKPLGTGGAVKKAIILAKSNDIYILNGDTFYDVNLLSFLSFHLKNKSACSISLKPMFNFERYGAVLINNNSQIIEFKEKEYCNVGLINGGVIIINVNYFNNLDLPETFSFEDIFIKKVIEQKRIYGLVNDNYFIDIGIPDDYKRAQIEFKNMFNQKP